MAIPLTIAPDAIKMYISAEEYSFDGEVKKTDDGEPLLKVSCVVAPLPGGGAPDTFVVKIPQSGLPKQITAGAVVEFENLRGQFWEMNGRSGLSFNAASMRPLSSSSPKAS